MGPRTQAGWIGLTREQAPNRSRRPFNLIYIRCWQTSHEEIARAKPLLVKLVWAQMSLEKVKYSGQSPG